jgi:hypothetical protein
VPGYRKVPGVIYARRYRVLEGTSGYSTVYEFAGTAVPESGVRVTSQVRTRLSGGAKRIRTAGPTYLSVGVPPGPCWRRS